MRQLARDKKKKNSKVKNNVEGGRYSKDNGVHHSYFEEEKSKLNKKKRTFPFLLLVATAR